MTAPLLYAPDLAYIHDAAFSDFAETVAPHLLRILRRSALDDGLIVEFGCGSGRLARRLTDEGYDVRGFDLSAAMIRLARRRAPRARFRAASLVDARIPRCDAVIGVGEVVSYVRGGLPMLARFFKRVHAALRPGGILVFDFMSSAKGRTYAVRTHAGDGWAMTVRAEFDAASRTLTRRMAIVRETGSGTRHSQETHQVRIYSQREMLSVLRKAGFAVTMRRSFGRYRLMPGDVAVVARRL